MPAKDITGQRFGRLVAVRPVGKHRNSIVWECACDCGNTTTAEVSQLTGAHKRSCGCLRAEASRADIAGQRFGHLIAVHPTEKRKYGMVVWECACDCGRTCEASVVELRSGRKTHCGCRRRPSGARKASSEPKPAPPKIDGPRPGQRFGTLIAVDVTGDYDSGSAIWRCVCDCNRVVRARADDLLDGSIASCGQCDGRESTSQPVPGANSCQLNESN